MIEIHFALEIFSVTEGRLLFHDLGGDASHFAFDRQQIDPTADCRKVQRLALDGIEGLRHQDAALEVLQSDLIEGGFALHAEVLRGWVGVNQHLCGGMGILGGYEAVKVETEDVAVT